MYYDESPLEYFMKLPLNTLIALVILITMTAGIAHLADLNKRSRTAPNVADPLSFPGSFDSQDKSVPAIPPPTNILSR